MNANGSDEHRRMQTLSLKDLESRSEEATGFLRVLANRERLTLLCSMLESERCVAELQAVTRIEQPTLSQQLGVLRREGMVDTRREGKRIFYSVKDPRAVSILQALHGVFCQPGTRRRRRSDP